MTNLKIYEGEQVTDEWFKLRAGKITGTKAHLIYINSKTLGNLLLKICSEKITGIRESDNYSSYAIKKGVESESSAVAGYELEKGVEVKQICFAELDEYSGCSPDGLVGEDGMIEIKCPLDSTFFEYYITRKIKNDYMSQMQYGMYICDRKWCDYVVYNENFPKQDFMIIKRVLRDEEYINKIKANLEIFINKAKDKLLMFNKAV